jgi:hypothetical protein
MPNMETRGWILSLRRRKGKSLFSNVALVEVIFMLTRYCRFGWTNASYIHGLSILSLHAKRALGVGAPYELYASAIKKRDESNLARSITTSWVVV